MKRKTFFVLLALVVAFAAGFTVSAYMQSGGGDVIDRDVIAGGGNRMTTSNGFVLESTIGQPVVGISQNSAGGILVHGYHVMIPRGPAAAKSWKYY